MIKIDVWKSVLRILDSYLEMNNHRKTPERYTILKAIYNTEGHFTLDELSDKLIRDYGFRVSRATLYNTLKLFMELRLIIRHRFQGSTMYEACFDNSSHSHQICTICGKVKEIKSHDLAKAIDDLRLRRFRKDGFTLYLYGVCSTCQTKLTKKKKEKNTERKIKELI